MTGDKRPSLAQVVVFCLSLAALVFLLIVGMVSNVTLTANIFLGLFFIGWVPAGVVLGYSTRQSGKESPRYSPRVRIVVVVVAAIVGTVTAAVVVPLMTYPLAPAVTVFVMLVGFLPTSALAIVRSLRKRVSP